MKKLIYVIIVILIFAVTINCSKNKEKTMKNKIELIENKVEQKVDVMVDGKLFTSFLYTDKLSVLKKPVLYPLISANGVVITRGYPLEPRPNERTDHPHHIGAWLNYGDVNNLDFWGNSGAMPKESADVLGTIRLVEINKIESGESGKLNVTGKWMNSKGETILRENTEFVFSANNGKRIIDRTTTLTAIKEPVIFKDSKEGMFAIRVARQLEHPSDKPITLSDAHGNKTDVKVMDNTGVTGNYLSSEGLEGTDVWGTRAKWVALSGTIDSKDVTVVIMDEPNNVGYPTYWMARGYGLFAANPLGQKIYSNGAEELNLTLASNESVTFKYRILLLDSKGSEEELEQEYNNFINKK
ncbi:MAG: PmoA family protein [Melioribacteraceae bacterium]|nr:PmoA family protein [Melioribacteraceae bacterium]